MIPLIMVNDIVLGLTNTVNRCHMSVQDSTGAFIDPDGIVLNVMDLGATIKLTDTWPVPATRIVASATGKFYVDWGDISPNTETNSVGELLLNWQIEVGGYVTNSLQKIKLISARQASFLPEFRQMIDKTRKIVDTANECFLGYTDSQLYSYLEGGLQNINAYQPSGSFTLENYPLEFKQVLLDSGLVTGVMSQELFAIDTDIPNYNDQGVSLVISHQPQLAAFLNATTQRLDKIIPMMKLQMINPGALHTKMGPSFRLQTLMDAGPSGAIYRGLFFAS